MKRVVLALALLVMAYGLITQVTPFISNIRVSQRTDGSKLADIYYDVTDTDSDSLWVVSVTATTDNWVTEVPLSSTNGDISGDCGISAISPGMNKHIIWNVAQNFPTNHGTNMLVKIKVDENSIPTGFVQVQGGTFNNGTSDVTLSSFYIGKYELTQSEYHEVMGINPASEFGVGDTYPVYYVSWFNVIEYCNRRSVNEGLIPCYSYSTYGTNPTAWPAGWNTSDETHTNVSCNWAVNGYRLPTEAEWEFAARGGNSTHGFNYSGSDDIDSVAWYIANSGNTQTVGTKTANELGIFDMSGNVWEWCWDIYGDYPGGSQTNPKGATSGSRRVDRGGSWNLYADNCTVSSRDNPGATYSLNGLGLRLCRSVQ